MKKFRIYLIALCLLALFSPLLLNSYHASAAQIKYLRVINDDTPFYHSLESSEPLFYLPYTYYVKVLGNEDGFLHVECFISNSTPSIDGYVPEGVLFEDELPVVNPYVNVDIKTSTTAVLYSDSSLSTPVQYLFKDRNMRFYGTLPTDNGNIYYVEYNDRLGYVKESDVYPFIIPNHPNELTFIVPDQPIEQAPPATNTESDGLFSLKVVIIGCIVFAGIIALFVTLKYRPKRSVAAGYYDENDYE